MRCDGVHSQGFDVTVLPARKDTHDLSDLSVISIAQRSLTLKLLQLGLRDFSYKPPEWPFAHALFDTSSRSLLQGESARRSRLEACTATDCVQPKLDSHSQHPVKTETHAPVAAGLKEGKRRLPPIASVRRAASRQASRALGF